MWRPEQAEPILLLAGGSGVVPLMSMVRTRAASGSQTPMRLVYSVRSHADTLYAAELQRRTDEDAGLDVTFVYTRTAPPGAGRPAGRVDASLLTRAAWALDAQPTTYVCGPTVFVEAMADLLVDLGHPPNSVRTERFG